MKKIWVGTSLGPVQMGRGADAETRGKRKRFWYSLGIGLAGWFGASHLSADIGQDIIVVFLAMLIAGAGFWIGDLE